MVRNLYASICGTDVAVYMHGPNTGYRVTLGGKLYADFKSFYIGNSYFFPGKIKVVVSIGLLYN